MKIPRFIYRIYDIAERHKLNLFGIGLSLVMGIICLSQKDMMYWCEKDWTEASTELWIPELGITKLQAWEMFWIGTLLSIIIMGIACITWRK